MNNEHTRKYQCEFYTLYARPNSCFFCDNCTDIFFDYDHGYASPYMWLCDKGNDTEAGMMGKCQDFYEEAEQTEPLTCDGNCWMKKQNGEWLCEHCQREPKTEPSLVEDSPSLVKDLVKAFCEDGTWLERQGVYTLTLAEAKQRAVDIIESVTQTETQNSNLTFEKDECAKEYEELGLKELKELINADRKTEPTTEDCSKVDCKYYRNPDYDRCMECKRKQTDCLWK